MDAMLKNPFTHPRNETTKSNAFAEAAKRQNVPKIKPLLRNHREPSSKIKSHRAIPNDWRCRNDLWVRLTTRCDEIIPIPSGLSADESQFRGQSVRDDGSYGSRLHVPSLRWGPVFYRRAELRAGVVVPLVNRKLPRVRLGWNLNWESILRARGTVSRWRCHILMNFL